MTQQDIFKKVSDWMEKEGRRWDWLAAQLGISPSFLSNMKSKYNPDPIPDHVKKSLSKITGINFGVPPEDKVHK